MKKICKTVCLSLAFLCLLGIGAILEAGTYTIPPCTFTPMNAETGTQAGWYAYPRELVVSSTTFQASFVAPLNLPNGITIKKITIYFTDELGGAFTSIEVRFRRVRLSSGLEETIANGNTDSFVPASGRRSIVLSGSQLGYKTINNNSYAYSMTAFFGSNCNATVKLHEIAITY